MASSVLNVPLTSESSVDATEEKDVADNLLASNWQVFNNSLKSAIGSGVIALPYAFLKTGWFAGVFCLSLISLISIYTVRHVVTSLQIVRQRRYGDKYRHVDVELTFRDLAEESAGPWAAILSDVAILGCQFGACTAFVDFSVTNIVNIIPHFPQGYIYIGVTLVCMNLSCLRSTAYLSFTSGLGNVIFLAAFAVVWVIGFTHSPPSFHGCTKDGGEWCEGDVKYFTDLTGIASFFGISTFALSNHSEVVAIECFTRDKRRYSSLLSGTMIIVSVLYLAFGLMCYLFFHDKTTDIIFMSLGRSGLARSVQLSMAAMVLLNYPLTSYGALQQLEKLIWDDNIPQQTLLIFVSGRRGLVRCVSVCLSALVAYGARRMSDDSFALLTGVTGNLFNSLTAFVLPALFYVCLNRRKLGRCELLVNWCLIVFGALFGLVSTVLLIVDILS